MVKASSNRKPPGACSRSITSLSLRLKGLRNHVGSSKLPDLILQPNFSAQSSPLSDSPLRYSESSLWEQISSLESLETLSQRRGDYKLLDSTRIDLPYSVSKSSESWIQYMPVPIQSIFRDTSHSKLLVPLLEALHVPHFPYPKSRVHAKAGHYAKVLERADQAGMISWSAVSTENDAYTQVADSITMSSFAVFKDCSRDRMISWPRLQNAFMPDPPYTDLPHPGLFDNIRVDPNSRLASFYFDVANMFHNISLPPSLVKYFPLKSIPFGNLPGSMQRKLLPCFPCRPKQHELVRPLQKTLPMGFKWAVYIAHTFAASCFTSAFDRFMNSGLAQVIPSVTPTLHVLNSESSILRISSGDLLLLHILDDINCICIDWPHAAVIELHRLAESSFESHGLPIKRSKSSPLGTVQTSSVPFIGWEWHLRRGTLRPSASKLSEAVFDTRKALTASVLCRDDVSRVLGKLVWCALGVRPSLSVLYRSYMFTSDENYNEQDATNLTLPNSVRKELWQMSRLILLSEVNLNRPIWSTVIAFDASQHSGAVVYTRTDLSTLHDLSSGALGSSSVHVDGIPSRVGTHSGFISDFVQGSNWIVAFTHVWRRKEHINALETFTAVMALEWASSFPLRHHRVFLLSDSAVCIGALSKGRSSSPLMCLPCRRFAATALAHDIRPHLIHVPTSINPADGPSRLGQGAQ